MKKLFAGILLFCQLFWVFVRATSLIVFVSLLYFPKPLFRMIIRAIGWPGNVIFMANIFFAVGWVYFSGLNCSAKTYLFISIIAYIASMIILVYDKIFIAKRGVRG
jgi:hypothetical protein